MPLNFNHKLPVMVVIRGWIQHYNHDKYWKYRDYVVNPSTGGGIFKLVKYYKLLYIKRCDAYNNASTGTDLNAGALFKTKPMLPHGLNGIIISPCAKIGANVRIYHQVTIGGDGKDYRNAPDIGDNVIIGAGAKIIGKIKIGDNAIIGAGTTVVEDVPAGATVVSQKARIII